MAYTGGENIALRARTKIDTTAVKRWYDANCITTCTSVYSWWKGYHICISIAGTAFLFVCLLYFFYYTDTSQYIVESFSCSIFNSVTFFPDISNNFFVSTYLSARIFTRNLFSKWMFSKKWIPTFFQLSGWFLKRDG